MARKREAIWATLSSLIPLILSQTSAAVNPSKTWSSITSRCFSLKVSRTSSTMIRSSTAPASLSTCGSAAPDVVLAGVLAGQDRFLGAPLGATVEVDGGAVDDRVQPVAKLADRAAVERRGDRPDERVVGEVVYDMARHLHRQAPLDVAFIAEDKEHEAPARVGELAGVARVADVPDQVLVGELVEFMVRERLEVHGGGAA